MKKFILEMLGVLMVLGLGILISEISLLSYEATLLHFLVINNVCKSLDRRKP